MSSDAPSCARRHQQILDFESVELFESDAAGSIQCRPKNCKFLANSRIIQMQWNRLSVVKNDDSSGPLLLDIRRLKLSSNGLKKC